MSQLQERTPTQKIGFFLLIWAGCYLLTILAIHGLMMLYFGMETYEQLIKGDFTTEMLPGLRLFQMISSIGCFGLPPLIFIAISGKHFSYFKASKIPSFILVALTPFIVFLSFPLITWALNLNQHLSLPDSFHQLEQLLRESEDQNNEFVNMMLGSPSKSVFVVNFLMLAILPALTEELLFRGTIQQLLEEATRNVHVAIFMTGALFSFIHFQFFGFLPRMMMGVLLGYLFFLSRNLWLPIFAHFIHNGAQVLIVYLFKTGKINYDIDKQESLPPYLIMIATVLLLGSVYIFDRISRKNRV